VSATHSWLLGEVHHTFLSQWGVIASTIIKRYSRLIRDIQMICENTCFSDEFLKTLRIPTQLTNFHLHEDSLLFMLPESQSFISSVLDSAVNATKSKYVIFLHRKECATVAWIFEQCWKNKLLDVVVISVESNTSRIYTYFPFGRAKCFDPAPVSIENSTDHFSLKAALFPKRKVWNLQDCILKVSSFKLHPAVYFDNLEMKGWLSPIFKTVAQHMNFRSEFIHTEGEEWSGGVSEPNKTGVRGDVFTGTAELGFMILQPIDFNYLDYDSLAMTGCVTWCLPATYKEKSVWWLIIGGFKPYVWLLLLVSGIGMVVADYVSRQGNLRICANGKYLMYMTVLAPLLQASEITSRHSSTSFRFLWVCWLVSSLVLSTAYLSSLKSLRTAPFMEYSVKNLDDLANAGFEAWYEEGMADTVDDISEINPAIRRIKSKSVIYPPGMTSVMIDLLQS